MATPILYTTVEAIRGCLGIDGFDVETQMILDADLESAMLFRLSVILPDHENVFDSSDESEMQLKLWCQYFGALSFIETAQLAIAKKYAANQDTLDRFDVDFEALKAELRKKLWLVEAALVPDLVEARSKGYTFIGKSTPNYDPVTGPAGAA